MPTYLLHADIVVQVHGIAVEADSHEAAVRKLEAGLRQGDIQYQVEGLIRQCEYEISEGYPVLHVIVDEEGDEEYARTTHWDPTNVQTDLWLEDLESDEWRLQRIEGVTP